MSLVFPWWCISWFRVSLVWVRIPALSFSHCVTLDKFPSLSEYRIFLYVQCRNTSAWIHAIVKIRNNASLPIPCMADGRQEMVSLSITETKMTQFKTHLEKLYALSQVFSNGRKTLFLIYLTCL